jgi:hypothetical protein
MHFLYQQKEKNQTTGAKMAFSRLQEKTRM